jgi:hypothetical protein
LRIGLRRAAPHWPSQHILKSVRDDFDLLRNF